MHRFAGEPLLWPDLAAVYDAFETPRTVRGEIELLDTAAARDYLDAVRARALRALEAAHPTPCSTRWSSATSSSTPRRCARRWSSAACSPPASRRCARRPPPADDWVRSPAARSRWAQAHEGFAYDNERPAHTVDVAPFRIARPPATNGTWMHFAEGGGYERREWWSDEGWAWKEEYDITHDPAVAAGDPDAPACHVSWFEADAFARAHGARLPTEAEWERAATWNQGTNGSAGPLAGVGQVWEWTASPFGGYPGFRPYPYREYSEVFFGDGYRVLRGGSWATAPRVATRTFRNWDLPQRRQIFSGVRLAKDA